MAYWLNPPALPFRRKFVAYPTMTMVLLISLFSVVSSPAGAQETEQNPDPGAAESSEPDLAENSDSAESSESAENSDSAENPETGQEPEAIQPAEDLEQPATGIDQGPADADAQPEPDPETPLDPMSQEAPGEEAPATDITVPPKDTYEGQEPYEPPEILWSSMTAADRKLGDARGQKRAAITETRRLRKRLKELGVNRQDLDAETVAALSELTEATTRLQERAVVGYQRFGSGSDPAPEITISHYQDVLTIQRRSKLVDSALVVADADIERVDELRKSLNTEAVALLDRARIVSDHLAEAVAVVEGLAAEAEQAAIEYEAFKAGSEIFIHGVNFPIAGIYDAPFDSYGFPRMTGTPDEHWHEGIDLFAARGTPLVATERGVITKLGSGRLGGLKFWLKGESGSEWYYAHLDSFAPGMANGLVVEAGQLVGYVGNTGNAIGTPPHLHMQLHPDGGDPVNPYPLLKVVSDLDQAAIAAGTHPGYEHQSQLVAGPAQAAQPEQTTGTTSVPVTGLPATSLPVTAITSAPAVGTDSPIVDETRPAVPDPVTAEPPVTAAVPDPATEQTEPEG